MFLEQANKQSHKQLHILLNLSDAQLHMRTRIVELDEDVTNNTAGDDSEVTTMAQLPIETATLQARNGSGEYPQQQPAWTPNDRTGSIPRYIPALPDPEYQDHGHEQESQYSEPEVQENPVYSNNVDLAGFLRAQVSFQSEQTLFLEQGRNLQGEDYVRALARFSRSQSALIKAHNALLSQLGVL